MSMCRSSKFAIEVSGTWRFNFYVDFSRSKHLKETASILIIINEVSVQVPEQPNPTFSFIYTPELPKELKKTSDQKRIAPRNRNGNIKPAIIRNMITRNQI